MPQVNTVLGPIRPEQLGTTLVHEHCVIGFSGWECDPVPGRTREEIIEACVRALSPARDHGLRTVIEATPPDLGRDVEILKAVSDLTGINIVCSTGRYTEESGKWAYLNQRARFGVSDLQSQLYDAFMYEITVGIGRSGVKAGAIKVATSLNRMAPCEEAVLVAAARASKETDVPVMTHTEDCTLGPQQARLLLAEGAAPGRIMIGHMCGSPTTDYRRDQREILQTGASIAFDRFGLEVFMTDEKRLKDLVELIGEGYGGKIMLSQDYVGASLGMGGMWPDDLPGELKSKVANWSHAHIFQRILPSLRKSGISDEQIRGMMVENPGRLFG